MGASPTGGLAGHTDQSKAVTKEGGLEDNNKPEPIGKLVNPTGGLTGTVEKGTPSKSSGGLVDKKCRADHSH